MTVYEILSSAPVKTEDVRRLSVAYEQTLRALNVQHRDDPLCEKVARTIVKISQVGITESADICRLTLASLAAA